MLEFFYGQYLGTDIEIFRLHQHYAVHILRAQNTESGEPEIKDVG